MNRHQENEITLRHQEIAATRGVTYLCRDHIKGANGWYELKCGHIKSISRADVKRDKFICKECTTVAKYIRCCNEKGLTYLDMYNENSQTIISCICNNCRTELHKRASSITFHDGVICHVCKRKKWESEAEKEGFKFLGLVDNLYGKYTCLHCSKESQKGLNDMRNGAVACECKKDMIIDKYKEEALIRGFKFINRASDGKSYTYECLECGEFNDYQLGAMRIGNVNCSSAQCRQGGKSKGQVDIERYINENFNVIIRNEIKFDDLYGFFGSKLRYDIGIYKEDTLLGIIEFDGIQHFKVVQGRRDDINKLFQRQLYDHMKNRYCLNNRIPLLRIDCFEYQKDEWKEKLNKYLEEIIYGEIN